MPGTEQTSVGSEHHYALNLVNLHIPQLGYIFPAGAKQGYLNLKGYYEFSADNRPRGWNVWLTFALSPTAPAPSRPAKMRN